ncbi:energy-coupling factor transporter ATPase [Qingrenia yutianensis]|uniref:Energy-coupling factor transporter ATP-binding protein EcfA2 n=1 Tax=Qingrenia yutianensis TaxID=2763676 RepID=A0A926FCJ5_9FIRM|nr:energy-coupling factor transporter ATPase [Qingrenia yutianensis]MBC8595969.1 energy-coupling factor transporter ATPase [Qingrenia yutianensis]
MSIRVENLVHIYSKGTPFEKTALDNVSFEIPDGDFVGIIGHTGSGKSTLIQHLNGLVKADSGKIYIDGEDITQKSVNLTKIRGKVGIVFQYPEYQLFEETVYKDIAFGPNNLGFSADETDKIIHEVIKLVGLKESVLNSSPFELSGGQKRRVALAGVIAMNPEILILDEPTAGLDPKGRDEILGQIKRLHDEKGITVVWISHSMEDVAKIAKNVMVMADGKLIMHASVDDVFKNAELLEKNGLSVPQINKVVRKLKEKGIDLGENIYTVEKAKNAVLNYIKGERNA